MICAVLITCTAYVYTLSYFVLCRDTIRSVYCYVHMHAWCISRDTIMVYAVVTPCMLYVVVTTYVVFCRDTIHSVYCRVSLHIMAPCMVIMLSWHQTWCVMSWHHSLIVANWLVPHVGMDTVWDGWIQCRMVGSRAAWLDPVWDGWIQCGIVGSRSNHIDPRGTLDVGIDTKLLGTQFRTGRQDTADHIPYHADHTIPCRPYNTMPTLPYHADLTIPCRLLRIVDRFIRTQLFRRLKHRGNYPSYCR